MLKIAKNYRNREMFDLFGDDITWAILKRDVLLGENGDLYNKVQEGETEVVLISRERYNELNGAKPMSKEIPTITQPEEKLYQGFDWLNQKYTVDGLQANEIAKQVERTARTIVYWLKQLKIPLRECGIFAIYPTGEQLMGMCKENQHILDGGTFEFSDLNVITDATPNSFESSILESFLVERRGWKDYLEKASCISQLGYRILVVQYYEHQTQISRSIKGPKMKMFTDYYVYIQSEEWIKKSLAFREKVGRCQMCGKTSGLRTHHNTYLNLGNEQEHDLIVLCAEDHALFHENRDTERVNESKKWIDLGGSGFQDGKAVDLWGIAEVAI